ncbi:MAG: proteophosphoglycan 5, partial [Staphylococcus epidermidis]|nr:proteophosphoglycan 5 [Staphylococcus epidermidis]
INASRNAQQSSQRAAQQATKSSRVTATKNKGQQSVSRQKAQSRSLMPSQRPYDSSAPYSSQYIATTYYNNWLFYYIFAHSFLNQHEKKNSVDAQFHMLKQQMKPHEKLYTVTVKTKQGKRVVVVPKKQYDKIEKGKHIKVKNGVVQ